MQVERTSLANPVFDVAEQNDAPLPADEAIALVDAAPEVCA